MTEHPDADTHARFVQGELDAAHRVRFEAHVAECQACAAQLTREARLELTLLALAAPAQLHGTAQAPRAIDALDGASPAPVAAHVHMHVDDAALDQFATGALHGAGLAQFEAHVAGCERCAHRLALVARFELALVEVASAASAHAPTRRARARAGIRHAVVAVATAAVVVLVLRGREPREQRVGTSLPMPDVTCTVRPEQAACVADAHRHGLFVQYPTSAGPPPLVGVRSSAGPSISPSIASSISPSGGEPEAVK
jgi:anti-sigma factor ChrR (cupin superfamily)